ncbi:hypothetical protein HKX48_001314 [Thoreauomyces humboldtii]|nr:hypothetical protein HKX48_001314 [Thoreauomyces humboldtii]
MPNASLTILSNLATATVKTRSRNVKLQAPAVCRKQEARHGSSVLDVLRRNWENRGNVTEEGSGGKLIDTIQEMRTASDSIQTVRKERVFDDEVTEEEMAIIQQRVALQQKQFQLYQQREVTRKSSKIRDMFEFLRKEEIQQALVEAKDDEDTAILNFAQPHYLSILRKAIAMKHRAQEAEVGMSEEQQQAYDRLIAKRKKAVKKVTTEESKNHRIRLSRLRLDEALDQLANGHDPSKVFEGWSDARVRAYKQIKTKPNSYYYRFNAPGEKQGNGVWSKEERILFFNRLKEMGADGQWGIFSMAIPGRVGYQCSNFYRALLKSGEVLDENYTTDEKGELRYLFGKKEGGEGVIRGHSKHGSGGLKAAAKANGGASPSTTTMIAGSAASSSGTRSATAVAKKRKRKARKATSDDDDDDDGNVDDLFDEDNSGTYSCKASWGTTRRTRAKAAAEEDARCAANEGHENPLPGFTDPITLDEVVKPAISPFGHVMSYDSWIRCLSSEDRKNICPLTKKPLTKRELVILTSDNIEEYRGRIINS